MTDARDLLFHDLEASLHEFVATAGEHLAVVAPFIKAPQLSALLASVPEGVRTLVTTRWRADEIASGVSDLEALDVCRLHGAELRLVDRLHAKLFVVDHRDVLVGSANLTARALGVSAQHNLEVLFASRPSRRSITLFTAALQAESRLATDGERREVAAAVTLIAPPRPVDAPTKMRSATWLPQFRSPDRLYAVYRNLSEGAADQADGPAMLDLAALRLPFDMGREDFESAVRGRLLGMPAIGRLEVLLTRPRRFGEVSAWISQLRPEADHPLRQRTAQTLLRWLVHFASDRFRIETPSHSEILSLMANDEKRDASSG